MNTLSFQLAFSLILLGLVYSSLAKVKSATNHPEQVHLSFGNDETEMVVTWVSLSAIPDTAHVWFGPAVNDFQHTVNAEVTHFTESLTAFYTYRALLTGLKPATTYYYKVGSTGSALSSVFHFRTLPAGSNWNPRLAIYGDLGYQEEASLPYLTRDVHDHNMYDAIFHVGDIAYNLHSKDGERGHKFMNSIESIAAQVPYQTCPGNHEKHANFSHYDARFSMLGDGHRPNHQAPLTQRLNNHFYSIDIGPAHIVMFSTEFYYYTEFGWEQIGRQFAWLEEDLKRANQNRAQRPWLIVVGHRSPYCMKSGKDAEDDEEPTKELECDPHLQERPIMRQGIHMHDDPKVPTQFALEQLFYKYGVDIHFYGHEHFYGRLLPVYNGTVRNGTRSANPYDNPNGPVLIVTGSAGNKDGHPKFNANLKSWVAHHHADFGYTRLTWKDRTHVVLEQTSDEKNGAVVDKIEIIKNSDMPSWKP